MPNGATAYTQRFIQNIADNAGYLYTAPRMLISGHILYERADTGSWKTYVPLPAGSHTFFCGAARRTTGDAGNFVVSIGLNVDGAGEVGFFDYDGAADAYETGSTMLHVDAAQWGTLWIHGDPARGTVDCSYWVGIIENYPPVYT